MSTCSVAVGLLSVVAVVHFAITAVLVVLIAVVCYYGKRNKASKSEHNNNYGVENVDSTSVHGYQSTANVYDEIPEMEKVDLETVIEDAGETEVHITNPWASSSKDDLLEEEVKIDLRRESQDQPKGLDFKRTESPRSQLGGDDGPRRRSRISIASITQIFHRKSVDISNDAAAKQLMGNERDSSTGPSDDGISNTEQQDQAVSSTVEEEDTNNREGYKTSMTLNFDFPTVSIENESSC